MQFQQMISQIENFYTIADFVLKEDIAEALKLKILRKIPVKNNNTVCKS